MNFGRRPLTSEFELLVECCRSGFAGTDGQTVEKLARSADWGKVVALSRRHRVQGLVWRGLGKLAREIPADAAASLSSDASSVAEQNLGAARLSRDLAESFAAAGIPILFVKGLTLSKLVYGDAFLKMGWDVDILVPPDATGDAAAELTRLGFQPVIPSAKSEIVSWHRRRKESVWRSADGLHVELHTRLADSLDLIPSIGLQSPRQEVEIASGIALPTLAPDDLFAYLCVHGASSAWFRLKWITDLAALLHRLGPEQITSLYDHARQQRAGRAADQALLLAIRIYGTSIDPDLVRRLTRDRASRWLADTAWRQLMDEREPTQVILGTFPIHLTQLFLDSGLGYTVREAGRQWSDWVSQPR